MKALFVIARGAGQAAFGRAAPFWAALAMLAAVAMGPTALTPADVMAALHSSGAVRVGLWALWLAGAAPAARAALARPDLLYLRALPIAPALWWSCLAAIALAVQMPWAVLFWYGAGAPAGAAAALGAAGLSAALAVRAARPGERLVTGGLAAAVGSLVAAAAPRWAVAAAGAAALAVSLPVGWLRAPAAAVGRRSARVWIAGPAPIALASYHSAGLWRRDGAALGRGLVLALAGGAAAGLVGAGPIGTLTIGALTLTAGVFGIAAPVARARREAGWLLDASGVGRAARAGAAAIVLTAWGLLLGAAHAAIAGAIETAGRAVALAPVLLGLGLALAAVPIAGWADRPDGVDGTRVVVAATLIALAVLVVLGTVAATAGP